MKQMRKIDQREMDPAGWTWVDTLLCAAALIVFAITIALALNQ